MQKELATITNQVLVRENGMPLEIYTKLGSKWPRSGSH